MLDRPCDSWEHFERRLAEFFAKRPLDRQRFIFRGQASSEWQLESTFGRFAEQFDLTDREVAAQHLLAEFRRAAAGLLPTGPDLVPIDLELLARHHGLPSPFTDWTRSPYIAAYFAYADAVHDAGNPPVRVAIWSLDLAEQEASSDVEVVQDDQAIRFNPRAVEQQAVFIRVRGVAQPMSKTLDNGLRKFTLPASERWKVLERLEYMRINAAMLFRSLDGAALAAASRVRTIHRSAR